MQMIERISLRRVTIVAWTVCLLAALLWPLVTPGVLLHRDMAVLDHPALSRAAFGFGDLPARNAPQDGLLALVGLIFPASWFARGLILVSGVLGAKGARALASLFGNPTLAGILTAQTLTLANPFVVERLLQGHWTLVFVAWLLPGIYAWAATSRWSLLLPALWLSALTPTGCIVACLVALTGARNHRRMIAVFTCGLSLPWLVPSLLSTTSSHTQNGASAFAARAESALGLLPSLLTLGGLWNADATPPSRAHSWVIAAGLVLVLLLFTAYRRPYRPLVSLATVGLALCLLFSWQPQLLDALIGISPGLGLLRDSNKLLLLTIPAYVGMSAHVRPRHLSWLVLALALLQIYDAPTQAARYRPVAEPAIVAQLATAADGRDVFLPQSASIVPIDGEPTVNPLTKALATVEDGALIVDGQVIDSPSARYQAAQECWQTKDLPCLERLRIGMVATPTDLTEVSPDRHRGWQWGLGLGLTCWFIAVLPAGYLIDQRAKFRARHLPGEALRPGESGLT